MKELNDNTFPQWNDWLRINAERHFLKRNEDTLGRGLQAHTTLEIL